MIRHARGITLIELMIALAISSVLVIISMTLQMGSVSAFKSTEDFSSLSQDTFLVTEFLRENIMGAGGGAMAGWMGIWVEDNCAVRAGMPACQGSDRLTISTVVVPERQCVVSGMVSPAILQIGFSAPGVCCLSAVSGLAPFLNKQTMLTLNGVFSQKFISKVDESLCQATMVPGQAAGDPAQTSLPTSDWTAATLSLITVQTMYWDPINNQLMSFVDANGNASAEATEVSVLADQIFDFQVSLGYDFNPPDGTITQTANGKSDEWLYNAPGIPEIFGAGDFIPPLSRSQLMLVQPGVLLGAEKKGAKFIGTTPLLNGPARTYSDYSMRAVLTKIAPRNTYLFQ